MPTKFVLHLYLLFALCLTQSPAQSTRADYRILAEYSILRFALSQYHFQTSWEDSAFLKGDMAKLGKIISASDFRYRVDKLWQYHEYELIVITDSTNFQLHGLNRTMFIINNDDQYSRYHEVGSESIESFISKTFCQSHIPQDSLCNALIDLYDAVAIECPQNNFYTSAILMKSKDDPRFLALKDCRAEFSASDFFRFRPTGAGIEQLKAYKVSENSRAMTTYWLLWYRIEPGKFWVTTRILLKGPHFN
jgi:hypothetical protein